MTATDELRAELSKRGVEYETADSYRCKFTLWRNNGIDAGWDDYENWEQPHLLIIGFTPAQAIAATLGATDAKLTQVESSGTCEADETDTWECVRDDLGGYGKTMTVHVMECTECGHVYEHVNGDYEYCPRCGRKRRDVEE